MSVAPDLVVEEGTLVDFDCEGYNVGENTANQTLVLRADSISKDSKSYTIGSVGRNEKTLTWDTSGDGGQTYILELLSTQDTDSIFVDVQRNISGSSVLRWKIDEGSGTTLADSIGSTDGSFYSGPTWESNSNFVGGQILRMDDNDNPISASDNNDISVGSDFSVALTVDVTSFIPETAGAWNWANGNQGFSIMYDGEVENWCANYYDGSKVAQNPAISTPSVPFTARLCVTWDSSNSNLELYQNANASDKNEDTFGDNGSDEMVVGNAISGYYELPAGIDNFIVWEKELTSSEVQIDYDNQPWS